jgi:hypothetical protein
MMRVPRSIIQGRNACRSPDNPLVGITVVWCCIQLCLVGLALSSWISADRSHEGMCESTSANGAVAPVLKTLSVSAAGSFVLVWQTLVAIGVSVWGMSNLFVCLFVGCLNWFLFIGTINLSIYLFTH